MAVQSFTGFEAVAGRNWGGLPREKGGMMGTCNSYSLCQSVTSSSYSTQILFLAGLQQMGLSLLVGLFYYTLSYFNIFICHYNVSGFIARCPESILRNAEYAYTK